METLFEQDNFSLASRFTSSGTIRVQAQETITGRKRLPQVETQILKSFQKGSGDGILNLAVHHLALELPPALEFWRELGRKLLSLTCNTSESQSAEKFTIPEPHPDDLQELLLKAPPMQGAEYLSIELLRGLWTQTGEALRRAIAESKGDLQHYLNEQSSVWHAMGRVCFHLAENKNDPDMPFAFLATYVHGVSTQARAQHLPLGRALQEYSGSRNSQQLLALLAPVSRASDRSAFIKELVESGDIYRPTPFDTSAAHQFLKEVEIYENAGLMVRMPDWWNVKQKPRPQVSVSVGTKPPTSLGMGALLDFDVTLTLGGETLTDQEITAILSAKNGLQLIKGKWVEVDAEKLTRVLDHWRAAQDRAKKEGVSFAQAMRLVAGTDLGAASKTSTPRSSGDEGSDDFSQWSEVHPGEWLAERLEDIRSPEHKAHVPENAGLNAKLRVYQKYGIHWLSTLRELQLGACLADDMGLGKTIQVIGLLNLVRVKKESGTDLIVVPASLLGNWKNEFARFAPQLKLLIAHPSQQPSSDLKKISSRELNEFDTIITTYGTISRLEVLQKHSWRNLIIDEAQAIKNPSSRQTQAIKKLRSSWRLALTGTPVENRLGDLWSLFDFINPGLLGSGRQFTDFCTTLAKRKQGYGPLRKLVQPYILRRLKTDSRIISDLPAKTETIVHCLLSKEQAGIYGESVRELKKILQESPPEDRIKRRGLVLAYLMRFKQICNHPSQWLADGKWAPQSSGKFNQLRELCETIALRQEKLLLFTQFREMTSPLAKFMTDIFGDSGLILHGGTAVKRRQELVARFQEDERVPFMVLSLKAGGTGLNLTAASHVVHFDRWWNPAVENQATDRAYRIGQKKHVMVHKFVCTGTIEERVDQLISDKKALSDEILSEGSQKALTELTDAELLSLVKLDLSRAREG